MTTNDLYQDNFDDLTKYEIYEEQFNPLKTDRKARRKRKPRINHTPKKESTQIIDEIADRIGLEGGFETTYQPGRYEEGWLLEALRPFYDEELITDVLTQVKGGKEASVYSCQGHPGTGMELLAAKVYRPRRFRNLRNDKMYREGRFTLTADGRPVKKTDHRLKRAIGKKTSYGVQVQHTSWLMYEYTSLERLHKAGAAVPFPLASSENAILMSYHGDAQQAASTLNEIRLERDEAEVLFQEVLRNIELMLDHKLIHGDLSAYNILYWEGKITLIDFPQVVNYQTNKRARFILKRDIDRVCQFFKKQGVRCSANGIFDDFWHRYLEKNPQELAADESRVLEALDEIEEQSA